MRMWMAFIICQRFLTPLPPEGSEMEICYISQRIKRGYGTKKCAKQLYDDDGNKREGKFEWGNAHPSYRGAYGDPPRPHVAVEGYKTKY